MIRSKKFKKQAPRTILILKIISIVIFIAGIFFFLLNDKYTGIWCLLKDSRNEWRNNKCWNFDGGLPCSSSDECEGYCVVTDSIDEAVCEYWEPSGLCFYGYKIEDCHFVNGETKCLGVRCSPGSAINR